MPSPRSLRRGCGYVLGLGMSSWGAYVNEVGMSRESMSRGSGYPPLTCWQAGGTHPTGMFSCFYFFHCQTYPDLLSTNALMEEQKMHKARALKIVQSKCKIVK